ncbi:hypothetical protein BJV77DRAFT_1035217 [Russula vinacea]|nr:hypothetical protein BJV77DRAFT_1035217 [Russula vinacea]
MDQVVLSPGDAFVHSADKSSWTHPLLIPSYAVLASIAILLLQTIFLYGPIKALRARFSVTTEDACTTGESSASSTRTGLVSAVRDHVERSGGLIIFAFQLSRLVLVLSLLVLSIFSFLQDEGSHSADSGLNALNKHWGKRRKHKHRNSGGDSFSEREWLDLAACLTYLFTSFLALVSVAARRAYASVASFHLSSILFITFSVYVYRDIWPLLTFTLLPADGREGSLLWAKVSLLAVAGVVIPLVTPRRYDPQTATNPEQTASYLSMMMYTFLDPIVFKAYRVPHLSHDMLPPLADYDYTKNLVRGSFKNLDTFSGGSNRHIFWGLMTTFRKEYVQMAVLLILRVITTLMSPYGMKQLLWYLETRGEDAVVRPWVWVAYLFLGPALGTIGFQWYIFLTTGSLVRVSAIITQLVFEHALRIRVKAETSSSPRATPAVTPEARSESTTPDNVSVVDNNVSETMSGSGEENGQSTTSSNIKGKQKEEFPGGIAGGADSEDPGKSSNLVGKMNNLVSTDLENIVDGRDFLLLALYLPLQLVLCIWFLYNILGWSVFVGLAVMIALFPFPGILVKTVGTVQKESMKRTDARVQTATETMNILRMVKLFGWEPKVAERLAERREHELKYIKKLFDLMKEQLHTIFWMLPLFIQAKVSLDRVDDFLRNTELLDEYAYAEKGSERVMLTDASHFDRGVIGFQNASFTWSNDGVNDGTVTPSRRFTLRVDGELLFKRGCFNLILDRPALGRREMHFIPMTPDAWYHLPRAGGVSYAAQESWIQNETIRDNILFGAPYDEERYKKVIYQCGLERDLSLFDAGDKTEVGEKGLTLSGGQKARITLARAVLAALDVHTARWIVEKCFKGDLIRGRTVLLVTHNVAMASPLADYVVSLGMDGRVASHGSVSDAIASSPELVENIPDEEKKIDQGGPDATAKQTDGKLIVAEEIAEGHVSWDAFQLFFKALGGSHVFLFWIFFVSGLLLSEAFIAGQTWFMGHWAEQYVLYPPDSVDVSFYLSAYGLLILAGAIAYVTGGTVYIFGAVRAARSIHSRLIESVLGTTLRWLDTTPTSRVITRVTQDIRALDGPISNTFEWFNEISVGMLIKAIAVVYLTPVFIFPCMIIAVVGARLGQVYMKAQIAIKREMSNAKAPVLGHFGAAVAGLASIRAYGAQLAFREESYKRINRYSKAGRSFYNMNRWISLRVDFLGGLFAACLAAYLIYVPNERVRSSDIGFSLTMAIGFSGLILWWVRIFNDFERCHSLERIHAYINIEQELKPTKEGIPPAYWPASGDLRVEKLSSRYSLDGPTVLHDISFHIKSGERVGVVGRTGSGKSSLTLSLLRCIFTEGNVYYDGKLTSSINLDALRSSITIIPQTPELLSGTLRENLDPFSQYDDASLNGALRASGLFSLQSEDDEGRLTLDSQIATGGGNLSVGQRQILALARAIVRGSKLLILDEDYKTDTIIQTCLRNELKGDVTLITVAHRLQTIIDADKVMVLDAGRIVEFDKPSELLKKENGRFRSLVDNSGDKDLLYQLANKVAATQ